jgi:hypothetical protein
LDPGGSIGVEGSAVHSEEFSCLLSEKKVALSLCSGNKRLHIKKERDYSIQLRDAGVDVGAVIEELIKVCWFFTRD